MELHPARTMSADRYSRQTRFAPFGSIGQQNLASATIAIAGVGALGTFHAAALARAGAGRLRLIDRDYVEWSNLQRQWLFTEEDAAESMPKAAAAARRIAAFNSEVIAEPLVADLTPANIDELLDGSTLVLDGTDNFETRYLINDWCVREGIPWIYGAAVGSYGLAMPIVPGVTACLACIYPDPPGGVQPTCETAGVLNTITAAIAAQQVSLAYRLLASPPTEIPRWITRIDVWTGEIRQSRLPGPAEDCAVCARREFRHLEGSRRAPISLCGRDAVQIHERTRPVDLAALARQLEPLGAVRWNEFALRFSIDGYQLTVFPDGRAIIKGTQDTGIARGIYSRYLGA